MECQVISRGGGASEAPPPSCAQNLNSRWVLQIPSLDRPTLHTKSYSATMTISDSNETVGGGVKSGVQSSPKNIYFG